MSKRKIKSILFVLVILISLAGCASKIQDKPTQQNTESNKQDITTEQDTAIELDTLTEQNTIEEQITSAEQDNAAEQGTISAEERAEKLLKEMSLEEKAGQMVQGARDTVAGGDITTLGLGSVLSGGGSYPGNDQVRDWTDMIDSYQKAAMDTKHKIPILYGVDAVHGLSLVKDAVVFPHNIGLGAANDTALMYQMGAAVAEEMKLAKIHWNFSPCIAVCEDPRWGRTYESYSSDPDIVSALAEAYAKGQADHGVIATVKHYVADGGTEFGTGVQNAILDQGDVQITEEELRTTHLKPYVKLVKSGVKVVMASFSSYQGIKMHANKYLLTDVLKKELGFQGFIVSDWEGIEKLYGDNYEEKVASAVNAGIDMLMEPNSFDYAVEAIINGVKNGTISQERVDDAVRRILTVKYEAGVFDDPYMEQQSHEVTELGSDRYRSLAKQLVEKSLVLLKNEKGILPLKKGQKIYVTGPAVNDIGLQCGGWGLTWQGNMDQGNGKITSGTTILEGLQSYTKTYGFEIITDKERAEEADSVILAVGEVPYAEFHGDTRDLSITGEFAHPDNREAIEYVKTLDKPVIALILAGRNVLINDYMNDWDSIVMCYLPGTEGDGIASVLSGETPFTGKLSMPYYKSVMDIGTENPDLLFPVGYGLKD